MKICPNCKAQLDDSARFCLQCMTSLEEKEQIQPPVLSKRRWPLVLLCCLLLGVSLLLALPETETPAVSPAPVPATPATEAAPNTASEIKVLQVGGVTYTFRPATREDHPSAIRLDNYYVLVRVEGTPESGNYLVPSFADQTTNYPVVVIADGAFAGTDARVIDLGHNTRYVWGNAFGGYPLTDLYLHENVHIEETAFSGCDGTLTIHCPDYLENTEGLFWTELAERYGFRWLPIDV